MAHNILKVFMVFACADIKFLKNRSPKASMALSLF